MQVYRRDALIDLTMAEAKRFQSDPAFRREVLEEANQVSDESGRTVIPVVDDDKEMGTYNAVEGEFEPEPGWEVEENGSKVT